MRTFGVVVIERAILEGVNRRLVIRASHLNVASEVRELIHDALSDGSCTDHLPTHTIPNNKDDVLTRWIATKRLRNLVDEAFTEEKTFTAVLSAVWKLGCSIATHLGITTVLCVPRRGTEKESFE